MHMDKPYSQPRLYFESDDPPTLRTLAQLLDRVLNEPLKRHRREGFILIRFSHESVSKPEYVSTCGNADTINILKLALAQLEGRIEGKAGHA
jgi:hypothetical protein